jgi:hypothetical protein
MILQKINYLVALGIKKIFSYILITLIVESSHISKDLCEELICREYLKLLDFVPLD